MKPQQLMIAAMRRKCICNLHATMERIPAAFVISMPFKYVMDRLHKARIYKPKAKQ